MNKKFTKSNAFSDLVSDYDMVDTLVKGTSAVLAAGETYLPKEPKETISSYNLRLKQSVLSPFYKRTIAKSVGKALARGINVLAPEPLMYLVDNVDGSGTSLETFSKQLLHSVINYGISYILVDMPINDAVTIADATFENAQPYFVEIKPTQVLEVKTQFIGSKNVLTYFRFNEVFTEMESTVNQVKEIYLTDSGVQCSIYRLDKSGKEYLFDSFAMTGFTSVPIIPVYGNKIEPFIGAPLLIDLAYLNLKHFRKQSDADWSEHFSLVPILALSGFQQTPDEQGVIPEFIISANTSVILPQGGEVKWVSGDSATIAQARESLKHLESTMENFGLELTSQQATGSETATGRLLDAAEANSVLKSVVIDLEWSIYNAFVLAGELIGIDASVTEVNIDKTFTVSNTADITLLKDLHAAGILTLQEVRQELQARKILLSETINLNNDVA